MRFPFQRVLLASCLAFAGATAASADMFEPLFTVSRLVGPAEVIRPGRAAEPLRLDHSYPYGSRIVVSDKPLVTNGVPAATCEVIVELANDFRFRLGQGADVSILDMTVGEGDERSEVKVLDVANGTVNTFITANTQKTGNGGAGDMQVDKNLAAIIIRTPLGECTRLSQRNEVRVAPDPSAPGAHRCLFATQSGTMEVYGPQYSVKDMKRNSAVCVSGTKTQTAVTTESGEFVVAFEKGADQEERALFKARCLGKIRRENAAVGGRMAVAVMIYYPKGSGYELKSYNYLEGQTNVGMWTSVAAAVQGEHSALTVSSDLAGPDGASGSGEDGESEEWNPGEGEDEGGWEPGEDDGGSTDDGGFDDGGFDFGW